MKRFNLYYRLNKECAWQEALPLGVDIEHAKAALLLAVKTIYRIGSNGISVSERIEEERIEYPYGEDYYGY